MSIWSKLFTLCRAGAHEAAAAVVDANALRILDQEIRDADTAQGKARDDLAALVARRRILEKEVESFRDQVAKYEGSARAALAKGDEDLAREVAQRIADLETEIGLKAPQLADMRDGRGAHSHSHRHHRAADREPAPRDRRGEGQRSRAARAGRRRRARRRRRPALGSAADSLEAHQGAPGDPRRDASRPPASWRTGAPAPTSTPSCASPASCRASPRPTTCWPA